MIGYLVCPSGILRSLSGEQASAHMRKYEALVDCLVWVVKAGGQSGHQCDDKVQAPLPAHTYM